MGTGIEDAFVCLFMWDVSIALHGVLWMLLDGIFAF